MNYGEVCAIVFGSLGLAGYLFWRLVAGASAREAVEEAIERGNVAALRALLIARRRDLSKQVREDATLWLIERDQTLTGDR